MMTSCESRNKFKSEINWEMLLRNVPVRKCPSRYARNVKLVSQRNRRQRTMKHVTKLQWRPPELFGKKGSARSNNKSITQVWRISPTLSRQNSRSKLDYTSRGDSSQNWSSCNFLFLSRSRFRTRAGCVTKGSSLSVFRNTVVSGLMSLPSVTGSTAVSFMVCSDFRILVLNWFSISLIWTVL